MLNETTIEKLSERLVNRIEGVNSYTLRLIGEQIARIGSMTPTNAMRLVNVLKYGGDIEQITDELAKVSSLNINDIYNIFETIAKSNYQFAEQFYNYRNINYIPYEQNMSLQNHVRSLATKTIEEYMNLSNTLAFATKNAQNKTIYTSLSQTYQNVIDEAILSLQQGKSSYQDAMKKTISDLGSSGIKTVDYANNYSKRLDSAVRMNIMDGMRNLHNEVQKIIGEEVGTDGVEISVHENPAEDHADIQGMQYSNEEFEKLNKLLERPISTMNCYHYIFSIILDVSEPRYTKDELEAIKEKNNSGFEFENKKYTRYEGQQLQRKLESEIRKQKDIQIISKASGSLELVDNSQRKITQLTNKYKELSNVSGLPTKLERLKVNNYKKISVDVSEYYKSKLIGYNIGNIRISEISSHILNRKFDRKLGLDDIIDTLKNPIGNGIIKTDNLGRQSINYIGMKSTISINPETGTLVTVWKTGKRTIKKYKGE